jgi:hypothetical protein
MSGHCPEKKKPGGCQLPNWYCQFPQCDSPPKPAQPPVEAPGKATPDYAKEYNFKRLEPVAALPDAARLVLEEILEILSRGRSQWAEMRVQEDPAVRVLCEKFGYGAVMDSASRMWYRKDPYGALVVSFTAGTEVYLRDKIKAALESPQGSGEASDPAPNFGGGRG